MSLLYETSIARCRTGSVEERKLLDWHMANLEFANAQLLRRLSMRSWDQDDPHELPGAHCFLPGAPPDREPAHLARRHFDPLEEYRVRTARCVALTC
jgi:hypothetical protein